MSKEKIVLVNDLSPGDILIMSVAIRALHKAHPGQYLTDVRSPANEIFLNNPYITPLPRPDPTAINKAIEDLKKDENHPPIMVGDTKYIISHYPEILRCGMTGLPFADGHRMFLERQLNTCIPRCGMKPDIFLSPSELALPRKVLESYWLINAGYKQADYTLKFYPYYQEVVDLLKDKVQFVQIGLIHPLHKHPPLKNVIDMRGKTTLRQLFLLSNYADGAVCCVSLQMVIQAALGKPCVVIAGAREGVRWQLNPDHRFLCLNGAMKCATYDGCWKSKIEECIFKSKSGNATCMELIRPEDIARAVELYYLGGRLTYNRKDPVILDLKKEEKEMPIVKAEDIGKLAKSLGEAAKVTVDEITSKVNKDSKIALFNDKEPSTESLGHSYNTPQINAAIFNTLRILKGITPTDTYFEAYKGHYDKQKGDFMDTYHFMWYLGAVEKPKMILEIGTRTGISICQLLSAYIDHSIIEGIYLCDLFNDGLSTPELVLKSLKHLNIPTDKINFIVGNSLEEIPALKKDRDISFDYILVDGGHDKDTARQDLNNVVDLINKGGYIVFDDLTPDGCSLQDVWDEFKDEHKANFVFAENHKGKGIGYARRLL